MIKFLCLVHVLVYKLSLEAAFLEITVFEWTNEHALEACVDLDQAISALSMWWYTPTTTSSTILYCTDNGVITLQCTRQWLPASLALHALLALANRGTQSYSFCVLTEV